MRLKLYTYVVTLILIVGVKTVVYAEDKNPPSPGARNASPGAPPPPGLQVPIDDYIPHLLILGVLIGGYFFYKAERQKVTNS